MPITQNDMIDVITAGLNFKLAYTKLRTQVQELDRLIAQSFKIQDIEQAQTQWAIFYSAAMDLFETAVKDEVLLLTKHEHYRKNYRNNELHAMYMDRKRRAKRAGVPVTQLRRDPATNLTIAEIAAANEELQRQFDEARAHYVDPEAAPSAAPTLPEPAPFDMTGTPFDHQSSPTRTLSILDLNPPKPTKPEGGDQ